MTFFFTTLILFLASLATGIFAFGGFHQPAPSVAFFLFIVFTSLLVMSALFEYHDYRSHHPRLH